jgi:hypothetical protein
MPLCVKPQVIKTLRHTIPALLTLVFCMFATLPATAQGAPPDWLEDSLYGSGKMNTVIAVVALILLGIGFWLFAQDRRLTRLEDRLRSNGH